MDGKKCTCCGAESDMSQYDWVITEYESSMTPYGKSARKYNWSDV